MSHIFISYSRKDIDFAQKIVDALAANNLDTWIDWKSIPKGEDWEQEIYRGIEEADAFLFLISADSVASQMCNKEIAHAVENGKRILPIVIRDADPKIIHSEILKRNWIFCRDGQDDFNKAIEETHTTVHTDYEWLKYHTELQVKSLKWEQKKDNSRLLRGKELREAEVRLAETGNQIDPQPTPLQRTYVLTSQRNEELQRRRITMIVGLGFLVMFGLAIIAVWQWEEAQQQTRIALARQLIAQSQFIKATGNSDNTMAYLLAILSMKIAPSLEAEDSLQDNIISQPIFYLHHEGGVRTLAVSPDGKYIATGTIGHDNSVYIWNIQTGKELARMPLTNSVDSVKFSLDSRYLVSAGEDNTVRVWNVPTGTELFHFSKVGTIVSASFSPDGKYIAAGSISDGAVHIWNAVNGNVVTTIYPGGITISSVAQIYFIAFSPDGRYILSGGYSPYQYSNQSLLGLWDVISGNEIVQFEYSGAVSSGAFSPDGKYVVTGGMDNTVRIWDTSSGSEIARMTLNSSVTSVAFSPDGKSVVSGSDDHTVRVWNIASKAEIARINFSGNVTSVSYSPDGRYVLSGSEDHTARLWNAETGGEIARITHNGAVNSVAFTPNGQYMVSGSNDGTVCIWEVIDRKEVSDMIQDSKVDTVAFSPDSQLIVSGTQNGVSVWETNTAKELRHIDLANPAIFVAFSPDEKYFASLNSDKNIRVWNVATGEELSSTVYDPSAIRFAFGLDHNYMVFDDNYNEFTLWEIPTRQQALDTVVGGVELPYSKSSIKALSLDGKYEISTSDSTLHLIALSTGKDLNSVTLQGKLISVAFSSDSKYAAGIWRGENDRCTFVAWKTADGQEIALLSEDTPDISPDGKYKAALGSDNSAHILEIPTQNEIDRITTHEIINIVTLSPNGKYLLTVSADNIIRLWLWRTNDLISDACSHIPRNLTRSEWQQYIGNVLSYQAICTGLPIEQAPTATPLP